LQSANGGLCQNVVVHQCALGEFELQSRTRDGVAAQRFVYELDDAGVAQLTRRYIHRQTEIAGSLAMPKPKAREAAMHLAGRRE